MREPRAEILSHAFCGEGSKPASNPEAVCDGLHRVSGEGHGYFLGETAFGLGGSNPRHRVRMFPDQYLVHVARTLVSASQQVSAGGEDKGYFAS